MQNKILVLIPAYNESVHIAGVIERAKRFLPVVVVDEGSTDDTMEQAKNAGADVLLQRPNQGKGAALIRGFQYALEYKYDAVVMLDADGQHDPAEIPLFLESYTSGNADLVIGERDFSKIPFIRRNTNTIGRKMFSWAVGVHVPDNQSGYRLLSARLMKKTIESRERNFEFEVEMIAICLKQGWKLTWVPIQTIYADEESHIKPLRHIYHYFRIVWKARRMMWD
ncbi:MAG: glycosyltransferase family 2 protein [Anaerolineaceae bacterium]|nr:glycosyltransferase family 2 protein [Anaerolineaceae bacterium]